MHRRPRQTALPGLGDGARPAPPHRLFLALWPDADVRAALAAATDDVVRAHPAEGRRLRPDRYHLTLQFLGDVPAERRDAIVAAASAAAAQVDSAAFDLVLDQAGGFASARVWWLGPASAPDGLRALWDAIGAALPRHGVKAKAPPGFSPHLTIARDVAAGLPATPVAPVRWRVDRFVLVDSRPPRPYRILGEWPLRQ